MRSKFQELRSEQAQCNVLAKRTLYTNTFLSTSGFRQKPTFSKGLQKEQEMHGYSEMKMAKAFPSCSGAANNSGSFWRFINQNLWFGGQATGKAGSKQ